MAVGTIISQFQGTLQIPLFKAPYSVKVNGAAPSGFRINCTGSDPMIGECYTGVGNGSLEIPSITSGEFIRLNYTGFAKGTIGGGFNNALSQTTTYGCVNKATYSIGLDFITEPEANNFQSYSYQSLSTFYVDDVNIDVIRPQGSIKDVSANLMLYAVGEPFFRNISDNIQTVGPALCEIRDANNDFVKVQSTLHVVSNPDNGENCLLPHIPTITTPQVDQSFLYALDSSVGELLVWNNIIAPDQSGNFLIGLGTSSFPRVINWGGSPQLAWTGGSVFSDNLIQFDNAALNASLLQGSSESSCAISGPRGFFLRNINTDQEYFVTYDGSKYWELIYVPQGDVDTTANYYQGFGFKMIDNGGIFWYMGGAPDGEGNVTPLFSLGYNQPYDILQLPVNSMALQCYSPCLGAGAPMTKI